MDARQAEALYGLTEAVRSVFHKLGAAATALHADLGLAVGPRAVLETVVTGGPQTVPQMARRRPVSRQHIQTLVNELLTAGYVAYAENPAHRRSKLVRATDEGRELFSRIRAREGEAFARLALKVSAKELEQTREVLASVAEAFEGAAWRAIAAEFSNAGKEQDNGRP